MPTGPIQAAGAESAAQVTEIASAMQSAPDGRVTTSQLRGWAEDLSQLVEQNPNDGGAQLGLAVLSGALAGEDAATTLGYDIDTGAWTAALLTGGVDKLADQLKVSTASLVRSPLRGGLPAPAAVSARAGEIPGTSVTLADVWAAADGLLAWIGTEQPRVGILGRLAPLADFEGTIMTISVGEGQTVEIKGWMVQLLMALLHVARNGLLVPSAYSPDTGDFDLSIYGDLSQAFGGGPVGDGSPAGTRQNGDQTGFDPTTLDTNQDQVLSPSEYLPPPPFGTLLADGPSRLTSARASVIRACALVSAAIAQAQGDPVVPQDAQIPWDQILAALDTLSALPSDVVTIDFSVATFTDTGVTTRTESYGMTLAPLYDGAIADIRGLLPSIGLGQDTLGQVIPPTDQTYDGIFPGGAPFSLQMAWSMPPVGWPVGEYAMPVAVDGTAIEGANWPPFVRDVTVDPETALGPGEAALLTATAFDPEGGPLTYEWSLAAYGTGHYEAGLGTVVGDGATATFTATADAPPSETPVPIQVTVTDSQGASAFSAATVWVRGAVPPPPG